MVLVELKLGEFEPQDKGQVELYLRWLEKNEREEGVSHRNVACVFFCLERKWGKMTQISQYELVLYKTSELYQEIQKGNWKEESEIEKLIELKTLVENLTINTRIVTDGASNLIQVRGNLPADKKKLIKHLEYQISNADEASLREYRVNLRHL